MNLFEENAQAMNDIVFAKRNKSYGAYVLRSAYTSTLLRALFFVTGSICTVSGFFYFLALARVSKVDITGQQLTEKIIRVLLPEPLNEKPQKRVQKTPPPAEPSKSNKGADLTRIKDTVNNEIETIKIVGSENGTLVAEPTLTLSSGTGAASVALVKSTPELFVDENAEYEGGFGALRNFIAKNLRYPADAREGNVEGTIHLRFVVEEDGSISGIESMNKIGSGLEDEAIRVVSKLPPFKKPAKLNGQPVKSYFQLPIRFKLSN
jgi:periplasmic protein TonB